MPDYVARAPAPGVKRAALQAHSYMPALWTPAVAAAARAHAVAESPNEAIGCVNASGYVPFANVSKDPENEAMLSDADMIEAAGALALFHSHPNGLACPSAADMQLQQQLAVPFIIQPLPFGDAFAFGDELERAPLLGRGFRHGVHDCYACARDWFHVERQIELPNPPRDWEWWLKKDANPDFYVKRFDEAGFRQIPLNEATQPGDGLFFDLGSGHIQHAAVVLDDHTILHHLSGRFPLDMTRPSAGTLRSRFARFVKMAVRHKSL